MRRTHAGIIGFIGVLMALGAVWPRAATPAADEAFKRFWGAHDASAAGKAVSDIVKSGVGFDEAFALLKAGRTYAQDVSRGIVRLSRRAGGEEFFYDLNVPADYTPSRRYQVRFHLHGGVGGRQTNQPRGDGSIGALAGAEQIYIIPYAWNDVAWWSDGQVENLRGILDSVKRTYNVDENRVVVEGVSDGATGLYYVAMRDTTPYASFEPLNGFLLVLANPNVGASGAMFPNNIKNKPLFVVNGGEDPLYPIDIVLPYVEHLKNGGVETEYHPQPTAGHNTRWWPEMKDHFETFVREHSRAAHPAKLTWESAEGESANRAHWLVIDRVTTPSRDITPLPDINDFSRQLGPSAKNVKLPSVELFKRPKAWGRVDLTRKGNTVEATTRHVTEFTLLLSPDVFELSQPVKVVADGRTLFEGRVEKSVETLMKWAARDNDRTMLFGAELHLKVTR